LLSTGKFAAANYIAIIDKEEINIYDTNNTIIAITEPSYVGGGMLQRSSDASHLLLWSGATTLTPSL
jgi:hypothetical protein